MKVQERVEKAHRMSIDAARRKAIRQPCSVVEVARVNEQKVHVLLKRALLHVRDKTREIAEIAAVVGLWERRMLVPQ